MSQSQLLTEETPLIETDGPVAPKKTCLEFTKEYAYPGFVLLIILLVNISNQMDRSIISFLKNPMQAEIGFDEAQYGLLIGYGFSLVYLILGLPLGRATELYSRKYLLATGLIFWSGMIICQGFAVKYWQLLLARIGLGIGQAVCNPASLSLIGNYFPVEYYSSVNLIYHFGIFAGSSLSSALGANMANFEGFDWRKTLQTFGYSGLALVVVLVIFVKEPKRETQDYKEVVERKTSQASSQMSNEKDDVNFQQNTSSYSWEETISYLISLRSAWRIFLAAGFRSFGGFTFGAFIPPFLQATYPNYVFEVNLFYGLVTLIGGISSAFLGSYLSKVFLKRNKASAAYISSIGAIVSCPFVVLIIFARNITKEDQEGIILCLGSLFLAYLFSEVWASPTGSLIHSILPNGMEKKGFAIYFFISSLIGASGPVVLGILIQNRKANAELMEAYILAGTICASYILSAIAFISASFPFSADLSRKVMFEATELLESSGVPIIPCISVGRTMGKSFSFRIKKNKITLRAFAFILWGIFLFVVTILLIMFSIF